MSCGSRVLLPAGTHLLAVDSVGVVKILPLHLLRLVFVSDILHLVLVSE